ncbi:MAG TPA: DUF4388 domain-containing protein [Pyrinomonadaceae bacterium]|nr:DUF4388 domain-containing protein [Pyrinomonadaceae bacterium]
MALTGHLSDLSLSELIEFFCNQRKSGRLTVLYPQGPGYFYLQSGSVVDARIGVARGIDAVYYALTLPNAKFEFNAAAEPSERTINQPWTQVVLEGLRRLDEGVKPADAFPSDYQPEPIDSEKNETEKVSIDRRVPVPAFFSFIGKESITNRKPLFASLVVVAVLGSVAAVGVPAGWYSRNKVTAAATLPVTAAPAPEASSTTPEQPAQPQASEANPSVEDPAALAARRQRERDRAKREERPAAANQPVTPSSSSAASSSVAENKGSKKVTVTVTYDESGRVVQASGGDPSAIRIARQKRFPPGKAGSATITIPIN